MKDRPAQGRQAGFMSTDVFGKRLPGSQQQCFRLEDQDTTGQGPEQTKSAGTKVNSQDY